jgi:hypothetical protein
VRRGRRKLIAVAELERFAGARCDCEPSYRASVWSARERRRLRKSFPSRAAAKAWREDAAGAVRRSELRATPAPVLDDALAQLLAAIDAGTFRTRGRRPSKPSIRRAVEQTYRLLVADRFGRVRDAGRPPPRRTPRPRVAGRRP